MGIAAALLAGATWGEAAVISLNITGAAAGSTLSATDEVGVVPAANWNNTNAPSGSNQSLNDLKDNSGAATTADVTVAGASFSYGGGSLGSPHPAPYDDDSIMMGSALGSSSTPDDRAVTFTNVPYALYDIYVYFGGAASTATFPYVMNVSFQAWNGTAYNTVGDTKYMRDTGSAGWDGTYNESLATTAAAAAAGNEYVVFRNISGSRFRIFADNVGRRAGLAGVQIVEVVPEPASLALLGLGGVAVVSRRRGVT